MANRAAPWYEVLCDKHGIQDGRVNYKHKAVTVGPPRNRRDRHSGGCPRCEQEEKAKPASS